MYHMMIVGRDTLIEALYAIREFAVNNPRYKIQDVIVNHVDSDDSWTIIAYYYIEGRNI